MSRVSIPAQRPRDRREVRALRRLHAKDARSARAEARVLGGYGPPDLIEQVVLDGYGGDVSDLSGVPVRDHELAPQVDPAHSGEVDEHHLPRRPPRSSASSHLDLLAQP